MPRIVVIGAGISGLTCAYHLQKAGADVQVLEASRRAGGEMYSEHRDGYLIEYGPNSLRGKVVELSELIHELGLEEELVPSSSAANNRYILRGGRPILLPKNPIGALTSGIVSVGAKLRAVSEPFVRRIKSEDESVDNFFSRRLGREITDYLVAPYLCGIFAGRADLLSAKHVFRSLRDFEQSRGSILLGALRSKKERALEQRGSTRISGTFSFRTGLATLPNALRTALRDRIQFSASAVEITRVNSEFVIRLSEGEIIADRVILATPAPSAAKILSAMSPNGSTALASIQYAPIAVVHLGFAREQFQNEPSGFGILVPPIESKEYLGAIFTSSIFPDRAPKGHTLISMLLGGTVRPEVVSKPDSELLSTATQELRGAFPFTGEAEFHQIVRWPSAIPQYTVGYDKVWNSLDQTEREHPGLHFLGSYRGGIAVGDCVRNATHLARSLV